MLPAGTAVRVSAAAPEARKRPEYIPNRIDDPNYVSTAMRSTRHGQSSRAGCHAGLPAAASA